MSGKANKHNWGGGVKPPTAIAPPVAITIKHPLLWLALCTLIVYIQTFTFGLTDLDDGILINKFREYNEHLRNLLTSFVHGVYGTEADIFYRPVPIDTFILNYQLSNHGENLAIFHIVNVLLHIGAVLLLYNLFRKTGIRLVHAFLLTLIFAVHPALTQAVAWLPARNETLLAIFTFSFFAYTIGYANNGKAKDLLLSVLFLLFAFFSKETALFNLPAAFILLVFVMGKNPGGRRNVIMYSAWAACFICWYFARAHALGDGSKIDTNILPVFLYRLPVLLQYLGKSLLPFNLSVYPLQEDTSLYYGVAAFIALIMLIILSKEKSIRIALSGLALFLLYLIPALMVPKNISEQMFEHRLYLPMFGLLLTLSQTVLFKNHIKDKQLLIAGGGAAILLSIVNIRHQESFKDPLSFWQAAVLTSPHSAHADMMLAARIGNEQEATELYHKAFAVNPNEKLLNFMKGQELQSKDSILESEKYLLAEKKISGYYECDFYLSRVAIEKKDLAGAIGYLETFLKKEPRHEMANNNLVFLYIDTRQPEKAKAQIKHMQEMGLTAPPQAEKELNDSAAKK